MANGTLNHDDSRAQLAACAMAGLIRRRDQNGFLYNIELTTGLLRLAQDSVAVADALLAELEK